MMFLDTHVVVWLFAEPKMIPHGVQQLLNEEELCISPAVEFELELLYEINKIKAPANEIVQYLDAHIGVAISDIPFHRLVLEAKSIKWTKDPFDRMIVGNAGIFQFPLITKDEVIRNNFELARWA